MVKFFRFTTNPNSMAENDDEDVDDELDEGISSFVVFRLIKPIKKFKCLETIILLS